MKYSDILKTGTCALLHLEQPKLDRVLAVLSAIGFISFTCTQGINKCANLRLLQRLSVIFGFRRDCP